MSAPRDRSGEPADLDTLDGADGPDGPDRTDRTDRLGELDELDDFDKALALANGRAAVRRSPGRTTTAGAGAPGSGDPRERTARGHGPAPHIRPLPPDAPPLPTEPPHVPAPESPGGDRSGGAAGGRSTSAAADADELVHPDLFAELGLEAGMSDWQTARETAYRAAAPLPTVELRLDRALGHTLAAPLAALTDLPAFDTAAMDGWAVSGPGPWHLAQTPPAAERPSAPAGAPSAVPAEAPGEAPAHAPEGAPGQPRAAVLAGQAPGPISDGLAVPIATGARIPPGTTAVLRSERGSVIAGQLRGPNPAPGADIRPRGQECRSGSELLAAGTTIAPAALGLAAAAGYDQLTVYPLPRVEVLVLGDELLAGGLPAEGRIRDALGPMVGPWLTALGAEVLVTRRLGDDAGALRRALAESPADLLVTTGSTAAGPADRLRRVLAETGARLTVGGVAVRPGHPMLLARLADGRPLVGLPGNPLAAVSGLLTLAAPLLAALSGRPLPRLGAAELTEAVAAPGGGSCAEPRPGRHRPPGDSRLVPVACAEPVPGEPVRARPLRYSGPAMLRGLAGADALAVVGPDGAAAGGPVRLVKLPGA